MKQFLLQSLLVSLASRNVYSFTVPSDLLKTVPNARNKRDDKYHMKCHQSHTGM